MGKITIEELSESLLEFIGNSDAVDAAIANFESRIAALEQELNNQRLEGIEIANSLSNKL